MTSFITRQVRSKDLSERLMECRSRVGLSVAETASLSGIQPKFIAAFEEGRLRDLPATVYVKGFLRSLARVYRVNAETLLQQFTSERALEESVRLGDAKKNSPEKIFVPRFVMSGKNATIIAIAFLGLLSLGYLYFQVSSLRRPPSLTLFAPEANAVLTSSLTQVAGKVEAGASVTINGQNVVVDTDGSFKENLSLGLGANQLVIRAVNKFNQETVVNRSVIFSPSGGSSEGGQAPGAPPAGTEVAPSARVRLEIVMQDAASWIELFADGKPEYSGTMLPSARREVTAENRIVVSTGNAGATRVFLNGKDLGVLGKAGETLRDIEFTPSP